MINFPIEILGILYNVQEEEYKGMNEGNLGLCDATNCEITIRSGLTPDRGFETFIHELTHAVLNEAGYRYCDEEGPHTEDFVERFSKALYQVILDNDFEEIKNYLYERGGLGGTTTEESR